MASFGSDFEQLIDALPDRFTSASIRVTLEQDTGELGGAQVEQRARAAEALDWLRTRRTGDRNELEVTAATAPAAISAIRSLEAGGHRGAG